MLLSVDSPDSPNNEKVELDCGDDVHDLPEHADEHQVLLLPVASVTAPVIGTSSVPIGDQDVPWSQLGSSCRAVSILGLPSAVVPVGTGEDGMPVGIQVVGRRFHDHEVLAVAREVERLSAFVPRPLAA